MPLTKEQKSEAVVSLRKYFAGEFELELSELQAGFLLEYFEKEIAPMAYNEGVEDAQNHFRSAVEDVTGICFREPLTYWKTKGKPKPRGN